MPKAILHDAEIHFEVFGSGPPLLLVPGLGGVGAYWREQIPAFAERFQVIVHDHRGTGQSTRSRIRYSIEQMAADVLALMDWLGIPQAHLVGHSTGAAIGQVLAIDHPDRLRGMVQYAGWTTADDHFRLCFDIRRELLLKSGAAAYVHATPLFLMPGWWIRDNGQRLRDEEAAALASFADPDIALSRIEAILAFDRTGDLHRIRTPTLVLCARDDILTPAYHSEAIAQRIPGARLHLLETGGHACSQTVPEQFNDIVLSYLETLGRGRP